MPGRRRPILYFVASLGLVLASVDLPVATGQDRADLEAVEVPEGQPAFGKTSAPPVPAAGAWSGNQRVAAPGAESTDVVRMAVAVFAVDSPPGFAASLRGVPRSGNAHFLVHFTSAAAMHAFRRDRQGLSGTSVLGYLPRNTLVLRLAQESVPAIRRRTDVDWIDYYHPGYKFSPTLESLRVDGNDAGDMPVLAITLFPLESLQRIAEKLGELGVNVVDTVGSSHRATLYVRLQAVAPAKLLDVARMEAVRFIELVPRYRAMNSNTDQVLQEGAVGLGVPYWNAGIKGIGQVMASMDSGLDVDTIWFAETDSDAGTPGPQHRKVPSYEVWGGGTMGTCSCVDIGLPGQPFSFSHGTLVIANILANRQDFGLSDIVEGMAPGARVHFQDIGDGNTTCTVGELFPPNDLIPVFEDALSRGALVHNNSWGSSIADAYPVSAVDVDQFLWTHPEFTILFAAGDEGPGASSVGAPATAKNDITVGATDQDPNQGDVMSWSGRGPETTGSGRIGPTVLMVGADTQQVHAIRSINGAQDLGSSCVFASGDCDIAGQVGQSCIVFGISGTSYSTSYATGALLLIRDYLAQGFVPNGSADPAESIPSPSGPLLKAMVINSTDFVSGLGAGMDRFNNDQGYGRVRLTNTLPLAGHPQTPGAVLLWDLAEEPGLEAGGALREHPFQVADTSRELRVSMAYYDAPAAVGSSGSLVNDLSLVVTDPGGRVYRGNSFDGAFSIQDAGVEDNVNPTEMVVIDPAELVTGIYVARIVEGSGGINEDHPGLGGQPYALVASGGLRAPPGLGPVPDGASPTDIPLTLAVDGAQVILSWAPSCLHQDYIVYRGNLEDLKTNSTSQAVVVTPSTGGLTSATDTAPEGAIFYIVSPTDGLWEGSYGLDGDSMERPPSVESPYVQTLEPCTP